MRERVGKVGKGVGGGYSATFSSLPQLHVMLRHWVRTPTDGTGSSWPALRGREEGGGGLGGKGRRETAFPTRLIGRAPGIFRRCVQWGGCVGGGLCCTVRWRGGWVGEKGFLERVGHFLLSQRSLCVFLLLSFISVHPTHSAKHLPPLTPPSPPRQISQTFFYCSFFCCWACLGRRGFFFEGEGGWKGGERRRGVCGVSRRS